MLRNFRLLALRKSRRSVSTTGVQFQKSEAKEETKDEKVKVEDFKFKHRSFFSNSENFWNFMKSGCGQNNNIVAQMSSVSVFAFIDK